jgi:type III secretion protein Q
VAADPAALPLPRLPSALVRLLNRLAGRSLEAPVRLPGDGGSFVLRPVLSGVEYCGPDAPPCPAAPGELEFFLEAGGEAWLIRVGGAAADALLAPPEGLRLEDVPEELRPACLALALEPSLDRASALLGKRLRLAAERPEGIPDGHSAESVILPFVLETVAGESAGTGCARMPLSATAMALLAEAGKVFPRRGADASGVLVDLSLCAGKEAFPLGLLRQAEPGDLLLMEAPAAPSLTLEVNGRSVWSADWAEGVITLKNALACAREETLMNARTEERTKPEGRTQGEGLSQAALDALEVTLTLELEERRISVGELAALAPGHTLQSAASLESPVTLKAGGRAIGKGRLVDVDGRLGVLISALDTDGLKEKDC